MAVELAPLFLSLKVAMTASLIVFTTATPLALVMARKVFPGKELLETLITLPMVLPPSVIGFILLVLFGKHGPLGKIIAGVFHLQIVFTWLAAVIAAVTVSFPLAYQSIKAALENTDQNLEKAARTLGAGEWRLFWTITFPLAWPGFIAGMILSFSRALGEFGATLMLAGNIPGQTQTMPLAVYLAVESGQMDLAWKLVVIMILLSFSMIYWVSRWPKKRNRESDGALCQTVDKQGVGRSVKSKTV